MSTPKENIANIRTEYQLASLDDHSVGDNPISFFNKWFNEALDAQVSEVNAMTIATVDADNRPHARIVLLKGITDNNFVFFTNYNSAKGQDIENNPNAALVFFWHELERQVRIEGRIEKISDKENDEYFFSRPEGSQIGAWSSPQSSIIEGRDILDENYKLYQEKFGNKIPRPEHWGGYKIIPTHIEFWQGRSNRMHDRILFSLNEENEWQKNRLAP
ncbi:MAG: pyridoxamine 5'-phosphate oxidase [Flavipsychrobacter sp.]